MPSLDHELEGHTLDRRELDIDRVLRRQSLDRELVDVGVTAPADEAGRRVADDQIVRRAAIVVGLVLGVRRHRRELRGELVRDGVRSGFGPVAAPPRPPLRDRSHDGRVATGRDPEVRDALPRAHATAIALGDHVAIGVLELDREIGIDAVHHHRQRAGLVDVDPEVIDIGLVDPRPDRPAERDRRRGVVGVVRLDLVGRRAAAAAGVGKLWLVDDLRPVRVPLPVARGFDPPP